MYKVLWATLALTGLSMARPDVYLIRHGEKPKEGNGLNDVGLDRAECIRHVFGDHSDYNIGLILAQKPKKNGKRSRPYETVKPLAKDLGMKVDISCNRGDTKCVKKAIADYNGDGNILICWEHHRMTDLVEALGNEDAPQYPDDRFDLIWSDPFAYTKITEIKSEKCIGIDWMPEDL
ncbi:phosphoglycerate mutase family protein [Penicillium sp. IBT 16267x]|nr:phosphoglycerate mutase family protein [Penicillium sp. IBT 16267x]